MDSQNIDQSLSDGLSLFSFNDEYFIEESAFINEYENNLLAPISNEKAEENNLVKKQRKKPIYCQHCRWTEYEDSILRKLVEEFGENDWRHLAKKIEGRNSRQCRERWQYYLNPNLKVGNWTKEEDELILKKAEELGSKWMTIKKFFPNRTDAMIKNRYRALTKDKFKKTETFFDYLERTKESTPVQDSDKSGKNEINTVIKISKQTNINENEEKSDYLNLLSHGINDEDDYDTNFQSDDYFSIEMKF